MFPNPEIFGFTLYWYHFFHWMGIAMAILFGLWYHKKVGHFQLSLIQWTGFILVLYLLMMFGGRLAGMAEVYLKEGRLVGLDFFLKGPSFGMFRWCGSMLAVLIGLPILARKVLKIPSFNAVFDMLALCLCMLTVFTKQGCQFAGDGCYGIPTTLPWGMHYQYGDLPSILPVHPTPIYDSLFHFMLFTGLLYWDLKRKKTAGQTAGIYFILVPIFYILLELIRINSVVIYDITLPQMVYTSILLISIPIFRRLKPAVL